MPPANTLNLVEQLRALAGVTEEPNDFSIKTPQGEVFIHYSGGSSSSVSVFVPFDRPNVSAAMSTAPPATNAEPYRSGAHKLAAKRPLELTLRAERPDDVAGKQEGVTEEIQVGDPSFDARVFIDTFAPADVVRGVLAPPVVRSTVLELLSLGYNRVEVDDVFRRIIVTASDFTDPSTHGQKGQRTVELLGLLAVHVPVVETIPGKPPGDPHAGKVLLGGVLLLAGLCLGPVSFFTFIPPGCTVPASDGDGVSLACEHASHCCSPAFHGALLGLLVGLLGCVLTVKFVRGHSNSHNTRLSLQLESLVLGVLYGATLTSLFEWYVFPGY